MPLLLLLRGYPKVARKWHDPIWGSCTGRSQAYGKMYLLFSISSSCETWSLLSRLMRPQSRLERLETPSNHHESSTMSCCRIKGHGVLDALHRFAKKGNPSSTRNGSGCATAPPQNGRETKRSSTLRELHRAKGLQVFLVYT